MTSRVGASSPQNGASTGKQIDTNLTQAGSRSALIKLRTARGADSPIGRRCSNVLEQLEHWAVATSERKAKLGRLIEKQLSEIERLKSQ